MSFKFEQDNIVESIDRAVLEELFNAKIVAINVSEWSEYEENLAFENAELVFDNDEILFISGYHAMFEMLSFDKLTPQYQAEFQSNLLDNMLWYYDEFEGEKSELLSESHVSVYNLKDIAKLLDETMTNAGIMDNIDEIISYRMENDIEWNTLQWAISVDNALLFLNEQIGTTYTPFAIKEFIHQKENIPDSE